MRVLFILGWVFLLVAFASAAAETIALTLIGNTGWLMSADELWQVVFPGAYVIVAIRIGMLHPMLWDPVMQTLLSAPAWALFGFPGVVLAWTCRPNKQLSESEAEDLREHEASLFLYDDLAREARIWAREEGEDPGTDDRLPNQDVIDLFGKADKEDDSEEPPIDPLPEFVKPRRD